MYLYERAPSIKAKLRPSTGHLKAASVLLASIALVACGGGATTTTPDTAASVALTSIDGTWKTACLATNDPAIFFEIQNVFTQGSGQSQVTRYSDDACTFTGTVSGSINDYTLGAAVTVDGSVEGITSATKFDTINTPDKTFDIVAIKGTNFYWGNTDDAAATDGSTDAKRPTQLDPIPFIKQ
jgi:hypothetical protein